MSEEKKIFQTSDLFLAAYLKGLDFEITDVIKNDAKITFCFADKENRKQLILDYYNGKGSIEPLKFARAQRELKGVIFNI